jgi:RNA polymerase sigma-70 factor (ECF subfamily)
MSDFDRAYNDYLPAIFGFFAYRVASRDDAEDLTQLTFERALRAWGRYDPSRSQPLTWLMAIARNTLIDHYRAGRRTRHLTLDEMGYSEPAAEDQPIGLGLSTGLRDALAALPDRDREIVALRFGADLGGPEIAALTNLTLANVQQILSRSLRKMRERLDEAG